MVLKRQLPRNKQLCFTKKITCQIERAKLLGEPVILIGDFTARLGRNLIKSCIHMNKNGKLLHELYISVLNLSL